MYAGARVSPRAITRTEAKARRLACVTVQPAHPTGSGRQESRAQLHTH